MKIEIWVNGKIVTRTGRTAAWGIAEFLSARGWTCKDQMETDGRILLFSPGLFPTEKK